MEWVGESKLLDYWLPELLKLLYYLGGTAYLSYFTILVGLVLELLYDVGGAAY